MKPNAKVLIVGAGAMGIITGYYLDLAGVAVTFLVRPNRVETLERPQILYCYDDVSLKYYTGYNIITSPAEIAHGDYDYVILAIDGAALRSLEGEQLVKAIGGAARGTETKVIIGTIGVGLRPRFLGRSGLRGEQVFNGGLYILIYQVARVSLPVHPPTDPDLLNRADFAYRHSGDIGLFVDDSAPEAARRFAEIYNANGLSRCVVLDTQDFAAMLPPVFVILAACDLKGWPGAGHLASDPQLWDLTVRAVKEVQGLSIHGEAGQKAQKTTTADSLLEMFKAMEAAAHPLDLPAFNRFHHGGKVFQQDLRLLWDCVELGEGEGQTMTALKELIARVEAHHI
jgi:hypothetical protein